MDKLSYFIYIYESGTGQIGLMYILIILWPRYLCLFWLYAIIIYRSNIYQQTQVTPVNLKKHYLFLSYFGILHFSAMNLTQLQVIFNLLYIIFMMHHLNTNVTQLLWGIWWQKILSTCMPKKIMYMVIVFLNFFLGWITWIRLVSFMFVLGLVSIN